MAIRHHTAAVLILLLATGTAWGAEFSFHPSIAVSEEFTDNVFETRNGRISDFITRALPGISLATRSPALEADVNYSFDYRHYARRTVGDDTTHDLMAKGHLVAVENLLFLDVSDQYRRVSLDVTRDVTPESLFLDQEDRNVLTASPYFTLHPGKRTRFTTGYRFTDTRYFGSSSGVDKTDHSGFLEALLEVSPKWYAIGGYTFIHGQSSVENYDQHQPYAGFLYVYGGKMPATAATPVSNSLTPLMAGGAPLAVPSPDTGNDSDISFFFGQGGYTWTRYSSGRHLNDAYWNAGASHAFTAVTVTVATGVRYAEDPLNNITQELYVTTGMIKKLNRGSLGLSLYYSEFDVPATDTLQTRKYGGVAQGRYDVTSRLNANLAFTAEKYDQRLLDSYTRRLVINAALAYVLGEQMTVTLNYIYVDYYSPDIESDNKQVNRAILEVRKAF